MMLVGDVSLCENFEMVEVIFNFICVDIVVLQVQIKDGVIKVDIVCLNLGYICIIVFIDGEVVVIVVQEGQIVNVNQFILIIIKVVCMDMVIIKVQILEIDVVCVKFGLLVYFIIFGDFEYCYCIILCVIELVLDLILQDDIIISIISMIISSFSLMVIYYNGLLDLFNFDGKLCILMIIQVNIVFFEVKDVLVVFFMVLGVKDVQGCYIVCVLDV